MNERADDAQDDLNEGSENGGSECIHHICEAIHKEIECCVANIAWIQEISNGTEEAVHVTRNVPENLCNGKDLNC